MDKKACDINKLLWHTLWPKYSTVNSIMAKTNSLLLAIVKLFIIINSVKFNIINNL